MTRLMSVLFVLATTVTATACHKGPSPAEQCDKIYAKGDGTHPYTTDKAAFTAACVKTEDNTRRCLLLSGKESFDDKKCGPGNGNTFKESMEIMKLGQGMK